MDDYARHPSDPLHPENRELLDIEPEDRPPHRPVSEDGDDDAGEDDEQ